jgi:hypothetical protein
MIPFENGVEVVIVLMYLTKKFKGNNLRIFVKTNNMLFSVDPTYIKDNKEKFMESIANWREKLAKANPQIYVVGYRAYWKASKECFYKWNVRGMVPTHSQEQAVADQAFANPSAN